MYQQLQKLKEIYIAVVLKEKLSQGEEYQDNDFGDVYFFWNAN
jgi:hypothetical protein